MKPYWSKIVSNAVQKYPTPFYMFSWEPVSKALSELATLEQNIPIKNWYSFKTNPIRPLIKKLNQLKFCLEVVSEYEFLAALVEGFDPDRILINGTAKHRWLKSYQYENLKVHFDSLQEIYELSDIALRYNWDVGLRCHTTEEYDPDEPKFEGQFGLTPEDIPVAIKALSDKGVKIKGLHFHLRSNISSCKSYEKAIIELLKIAKRNNLSLDYIDCGGGFPVYGERPIDADKELYLNFNKLRSLYNSLTEFFPGLKEVWLENGRFVTARSAVLVMRVWDIKTRAESKYLICDGGRTNHALVSDWEHHNFFLYPPRRGKKVRTTVCGPTCMAFDRILRDYLPNSIKIGDYFVWMNAGAYHIPWETRFSDGLARVLWVDGNEDITLAREKESFSQWWGHWENDENPR